MVKAKTTLNHHGQKQTNEQCLITTYDRSYNHKNKPKRLKTISQNRPNINDNRKLNLPSKKSLYKQVVCKKTLYHQVEEQHGD